MMIFGMSTRIICIKLRERIRKIKESLSGVADRRYEAEIYDAEHHCDGDYQPDTVRDAIAIKRNLSRRIGLAWLDEKQPITKDIARLAKLRDKAKKSAREAEIQFQAAVNEIADDRRKMQAPAFVVNRTTDFGTTDYGD